MAERICPTCGSDVGPTSLCQNCGARSYRYATEELVSDHSRSVDLTEGLRDETPTPPPVSERQELRTHLTGFNEDEAVFTQRQQRAEVTRLEHPSQPVDPFGTNTGSQASSTGSPAFQILIRMVLIGLLFLGVLLATFNSWAGDQAGSFAQAAPVVTIAPITVDTVFVEQRLLSSWSDLAVGDCVLWPGDVGGPPTAVDCSVLHDAEITGAGTLPDDAWSETPAINLSELCLAQFPVYVGQTFQLSRWRTHFTVANEAAWDTGDHTYQCYVYLRNEQTDDRAYQSGT